MEFESVSHRKFLPRGQVMKKLLLIVGLLVFAPMLGCGGGGVPEATEKEGNESMDATMKMDTTAGAPVAK